MKRKNINKQTKTILLILCLSMFISSLHAKNVDSKLGIEASFSGLIETSYDISESNDAVTYNAGGNNLVISPFLKYNKFYIGLSIGFLNIDSSSFVGNNRQRPFNGYAGGINIGYEITKKLSVLSIFMQGMAALGKTDNLEAYLQASVLARYIVCESNHIQLAIVTPLNLIYRKELLCPAFGIGLSISGMTT
ncbi:MAG: hypothetical protein LKE40_14955 [Spirochaetia bacterium]|jgi:hypothetical protein|nr:hypothetical protein [Spirochaetia bacterium]